MFIKNKRTINLKLIKSLFKTMTAHFNPLFLIAFDS